MHETPPAPPRYRQALFYVGPVGPTRKRARRYLGGAGVGEGIMLGLYRTIREVLIQPLECLKVLGNSLWDRKTANFSVGPVKKIKIAF